MADTAATETATSGAETATPRPPATSAAWLVVLVVGGLAVALIVTLSFSADNTGIGVDGRSATTSQHLDDE